MKDIIFDVDGTLWDTTEVVAEAWNRAIQEFGNVSVTVDGARLKKEFGKTMDVIAERLFPELDGETRSRIMDMCCAQEHHELRETAKNLLYPDVVETIKALAANHRLFIVSNCQSGYIELFMEKAGIELYITDWECFGDTGKVKGENIKLLMERNHIIDGIYVGDTQGDYEATQLAGIPFVFARYGFGSVPDCPKAIDGMQELLDME